MKIKKNNIEPRLKDVIWYYDDLGNPVYKDTPKFSLDDKRRLKLELKILQQPPKLSKGKIIVPD